MSLKIQVGKSPHKSNDTKKEVVLTFLKLMVGEADYDLEGQLAVFCFHILDTFMV